MSIFNDCYETTIGSAYVTKAIDTAIREHVITAGENQLNTIETGTYRANFLCGYDDGKVPLFTHPIIVSKLQSHNYLCIDMRLFLRPPVDGEDRLEKRIKNMTEYNFTKSRGILNLIWINGGVTEIKNNLSFAGVVFAWWLSDVISKTYALDFKDQTSLAILSSFYYQTLFSNETEITDDIKQKMAVHTIKATKAPAEMVFDVFDKIKKLDNIEDFCSNVTSILENVRLHNFNLALLLNIIRNSWYGTNAKEILSVAVEHPPTWASIVYAALSERTYRSSAIYRVAERWGKRGGSDEFMRSYHSLMQDYTLSNSNESYPNDEIIYRDFD